MRLEALGHAKITTAHEWPGHKRRKTFIGLESRDNSATAVAKTRFDVLKIFRKPAVRAIRSSFNHPRAILRVPGRLRDNLLFFEKFLVLSIKLGKEIMCAKAQLNLAIRHCLEHVKLKLITPQKDVVLAVLHLVVHLKKLHNTVLNHIVQNCVVLRSVLPSHGAAALQEAHGADTSFGLIAFLLLFPGLCLLLLRLISPSVAFKVLYTATAITPYFAIVIPM
mmetsp:Transcript_6216/g.10773  ORF Transcript_6216/g.10773 Transcript_6216/m.10773 type:complete len:222 (-) Transcript_6216:816-1481(-)